MPTLHTEYRKVFGLSKKIIYEIGKKYNWTCDIGLESRRKFAPLLKTRYCNIKDL